MPSTIVNPFAAKTQAVPSSATETNNVSDVVESEETTAQETPDTQMTTKKSKKGKFVKKSKKGKSKNDDQLVTFYVRTLKNLCQGANSLLAPVEEGAPVAPSSVGGKNTSGTVTHVDASLTNGSVEMLNTMNEILLNEFGGNLENLVMGNGKTTISADNILTTLQVLLPFEFRAECDRYVRDAVQNYETSNSTGVLPSVPLTRQAATYPELAIDPNTIQTIRASRRHHVSSAKTHNDASLVPNDSVPNTEIQTQVEVVA